MAPAATAVPPLSALAQRLQAGGQTGAWEVADAGFRRRAEGADVLLLTLGDPEVPPHPAIIAATTAALAAGRTHYAPLLGDPGLRAAVAAQEGAEIGNVAIVPGAQHGGFAALALLAGPGDEVILSNPHYATYPGVVAATGARAVKVEVGADLGVDVAAIAAAVTPATRAIFLNSPANPTGAALGAADFAALGALCRRHRLWLVVDEVYARFGFTAPPLRAWQHGPAGQTIVVNSLSKSHAMTGYRIGWMLAPAAVIARLQDWSAAALFGVSQFVQDGALAALALPDAALADYRQGFRQRAGLAVAQANAIPGLRARLPDGGMFLMLDCRAIDADDVRLAWRLLAEAGVAVIPGSGFGSGGRGHLRISLTPSAATIAEALARIARVVRAG